MHSNRDRTSLTRVDSNKQLTTVGSERDWSVNRLATGSGAVPQTTALAQQQFDGYDQSNDNNKCT
jgi:hypothetical protein